MTPDQAIPPSGVRDSQSPRHLNRREFAGGLGLAVSGFLFPRSSVEARQTQSETLQNFPPEFGELLPVDPEIQRRAGEAFEEFYPQWTDRWIADGDLRGEKRIVFNPEDESTNSEVQAIGLELAATVEDWELFDSLVEYVKNKRNSDGLMTYYVGSDGYVLDSNSVVDADLGIVQALCTEAQKRGKYTDMAREYSQNVLAHDVDQDTFLFQGGNNWGGPKDGYVNPSYNITGAYLMAHELFSDEDWLRVKSAQEWLYDQILQKQSETGLIPNWSAPDGSRVDLSTMRAVAGVDYPEDQLRIESHGFGYEAPRIGQRVGTGAMWFGSEHDKRILERMAEFFASHQADTIAGHIDIQTGEPLVTWPESLVLANAAISLVTLDAKEAQTAYLEESVRIYTPDSEYVTNQAEPLKAWALLSGKMKPR